MQAEPTNWSRRYKQNVELLRSGDLADVAVVVERLEARSRDKGLSQGEAMLRRGRDILVTEASFGLPDGWEGDDGGAGVREPAVPDPGRDSGSGVLELPEGLE